MKILHIAPSYYPTLRFGGPIQSVHLLNKALVNKGVKVDVLTTDAGQVIDYKITKLQDYKIDSERFYLIDGVRVKYLSFIGYEHYNFSLQMLREIWKIIDNYDLVHITAVWNFPVLAGSLISILKKKLYIISPRGVFHQEALSSKSVLSKKIYFHLFAKHYLKKVSAIHYTSSVEKEESEKILALRNSFIVPNGIDLNHISDNISGDSIRKFGINESAKYSLILGRIHPIKGFDLLIPAFSNIAKVYKDLYLVIAGNQSTPYIQSVNQLVTAKWNEDGSINQHELSERVIFTGEVTGADKWALYKNALMFVLPSYSENFGMSVVEAMACGCPVVISDKVGIYKEVEKADAGIIVKTDPESVEAGIRSLIEDEKLRKRISVNGMRLVQEKYNVESVADQMIEEYKRIVQSAKERKKKN